MHMLRCFDLEPVLPEFQKVFRKVFPTLNPEDYTVNRPSDLLRAYRLGSFWGLLVEWEV